MIFTQITLVQDFRGRVTWFRVLSSVPVVWRNDGTEFPVSRQ